MSEFSGYLTLGLGHILDPGGYDHVLFIAALFAAETASWSRRLWLLTAFTLGHSATLALATLQLVQVDAWLIELLIPLTIVATCVGNLVLAEREASRRIAVKFALAAGFGMIHGLGFSSFLAAVLGGSESLLVPLLAFNVGLEVGQVVVVGLLALLTFLVTRLPRVSPRRWTMVLNVAATCAAVVMIAERTFPLFAP